MSDMVKSLQSAKFYRCCSVNKSRCFQNKRTAEKFSLRSSCFTRAKSRPPDGKWRNGHGFCMERRKDENFPARHDKVSGVLVPATGYPCPAIPSADTHAYVAPDIHMTLSCLPHYLQEIIIILYPVCILSATK